MKRITPPACVGLALLLLSVTRCELTPSQQFEPELCVHCLLFTGTNAPQVHVNRTYAMEEEPEPWLDSVGITLARGAASWSSFHPNPSNASLYYHTGGPIAVRPNDTFSTRVTCPGYDTAYGTTVVPDTFSIRFPRPGDTITTEDSLTWTESHGCKGYYTSFRRETPRGDTFDINVLIANDSFAGYLPLFFLFQEPEGEYTLRLAALDTNYYDWISAGAGFGPGHGMQQPGIPSTVTGGVGVFGSAALCSVRVYLKPDTVMGRPGQSPGSNQSSR